MGQKKERGRVRREVGLMQERGMGQKREVRLRRERYGSEERGRRRER